MIVPFRPVPSRPLPVPVTAASRPEEMTVHLLMREGTLLPAPEPVPADADGARTLAALYAMPQLPPGGAQVRAMMNATVDGAISGADGTSGPLRNPDDSFVFDVLRALADVVMVGAATVRVEDYSSVLGRDDLLEPSWRPGGGARPALAVWSNSGDLPASLDRDQPLYLLSSARSALAAGRRAGLPEDRVIVADSATEALRGLADRGLHAVQAEGGSSTLGRLAAEGVLDELCFSTTHRSIGGSSSRVISGESHDSAWELSSLLVGDHATISRYRIRP
ncbi:MAG: dihydrofolate reductase family protein [Brachybacterium tyrofermentans]